MPYGLFIQAPCGSGKSTWIQSLSSEQQKIWLDGDEVLTNEDIKNRNYFWYTEENIKEREKIKDIFKKYLNQGYNILYSGNPNYLKTDILVIPNMESRWHQLQSRQEQGGWAPSYEKFQQEEQVYQDYIKAHPEIPVYSSFNNLV